MPLNKDTLNLLLLDELVGLTSIREIEILQQETLKILSRLLENKRVSLYVFDGKNICYKVLSYPENPQQHYIKTSRFDTQVHEILGIDVPDYILNAAKLIDDERTFHCEKRSHIFHYVYPHTVENRVVGYVTFECARKLNISKLSMIESFLDIIDNFQSLLEDNQNDKLTGLLNRKTFEDKVIDIQNSIQGTSRFEFIGNDERDANKSNIFWLSIMDIDHFKKINDTFGHVYGDEVLLLMAQLMRKCFRQNDLLFRFGGEEFVVIISTKSKDIAEMVIERFRQTVEEYSFPQIDQVTISIGVTRLSKEYEIPSDIVGRADQALYFAKDHNRNQTRFYEKLIASGELKSESNVGSIEFF